MIDKPTLDDLTRWITEEVKLPIHADRELQLAALLSAVLDALTQIGPKTTERVLIWAFLRHGIKPGYGIQGVWDIRDRRPPPQIVTPTAAPPPNTEHVCSICGRRFATVHGLWGHSRAHKAVKGAQG